ncbi:hypothetical protein L7F22_011050 [Adiantum nelumboides]|nr:hypothetical protein [Adiantum nelumboides]
MTYNNATVDMKILHLDKNYLIVDATALGSSPRTPSTNGNGSCVPANEESSLSLPSFPSGPFVISDDNQFGSFGCSIGVFAGAELVHNASTSEPDASRVEVGGCAVLCPSDVKNPKCDGHTCCVTNLSQGTSFRGVSYYVTPSSIITNSPFDANAECQSLYATVFHPSYRDFSNNTYGIKLKWALPSNQMKSALKRTPDYACSNNSDNEIVQEVPGYYCFCLDGFEGDGYSEGLGCTTVIFVGLLLGGVVIFAIWWRRRTKRKYFLQNGGLQLQDMIVKAGGQWDQRRLFTAHELQEATENYADHMKLGMGGFGTVFKGVLSDGRPVAIKKANRAEGGNEEFLNELQILMHINHRNVVRLLGCCMEIATPLLVYEYVSHGNVRENLDEGGTDVMSWEQRLKVARQSAEALAYLHAAAFPPILHRDVKSANVLLDDNLDAKVADFGASRLVPDGVQHVSTAVQGTIGYLDPEYFQTLQLTDKSDVYSLGVMLVELISGLKPVDSRTREPEFTNLALLFINHMQEARGEDLIDPRLVEPSTLSNDKSLDVMMVQVRSSIMAVADLAHQCLALHGDERPSMSLLADELRRIAHALRDGHYDKDTVNDYQRRPLIEHGEAGAAISQDAEFFVKSTSSTISISNLQAPSMPR